MKAIRSLSLQAFARPFHYIYFFLFAITGFAFSINLIGHYLLTFAPDQPNPPVQILSTALAAVFLVAAWFHQINVYSELHHIEDSSAPSVETKDNMYGFLHTRTERAIRLVIVFLLMIAFAKAYPFYDLLDAWKNVREIFSNRSPSSNHYTMSIDKNQKMFSFLYVIFLVNLLLILWTFFALQAVKASSDCDSVEAKACKTEYYMWMITDTVVSVCWLCLYLVVSLPGSEISEMAKLLLFFLCLLCVFLVGARYGAKGKLKDLLQRWHR